MKIALLEDDKIIAEQIKSYFELFDYKVDIFNNGEELLDSSNLRNYDILLLDINTPKISGIEALKTIRALNIDTPAIFITAMSGLDYLKEAFSIGCSDYIKKPFDIEELELRINNIVNSSKSKVSLKDGYSFNLKKEKLYKDGIEVKLNSNERKFLYLLVKNLNESVDSQFIKSYIWEDKDICENTLRTTVKKLRAKLKSNFIKNIRGVGYKIEL